MQSDRLDGGAAIAAVEVIARRLGRGGERFEIDADERIDGVDGLTASAPPRSAAAPRA